MTIKDRVESLKQKFNEDDRYKKWLQVVQKVLLVVVVGLIIYNLFQIGWLEVLQSLPTQPLFYVLFVLIFLSLPVAEIFIYRQVWPLKRRDIFKAMLTKRVYNEEVMGYSGELYLLPWARKRLDKSDWEILANIRDNNILSSINSASVGFVLIGILIFTGVIDPNLVFDNVNFVYVITGLVVTIAIFAILLQFRRYIFSLPLKKALKVYSIYFSRFIIHHALFVAQWAVVIPETPISIWLIFITLMIVVNRIPFLPSHDLVFLWAGIELAKVLDMTTSSVAGMLLVFSALKKSANFILYIMLTWQNKGKEIEKG